MKRLILICLIGFVFSNIFAAQYIVPRKPASVDVADIDMDGDQDIVLGHHYAYNWTGITILDNTGNGTFTSSDTFYFGGNHGSLIIERINSNPQYDIITQYFDDVSNSGVGLIFDYVNGNFFYDTYFLSIGADILDANDIDNDFDVDIIFESHY
ncbi:MAG: hypothetical protein GWN00_20080, partial [Aliifodinibius sp.]|nr:hypothetical protein [Fodinibius sp.]NIV13311.1 hypothetical protein [Fodinibius sp.]NIY27021.1 hypothetical protein [Fodinibius sp.]